MTIETSPTSTVLATPLSSPSWKIKLLYDSECPLCMREVRFLQRRDRNRGIVKFVDIADLNYAPADHSNISFEQAMGRIHGVLPNGSVLVNIEVFRYIYDNLGIGWVYAPTKLKPIEHLFNGVYGLWAKWRLTLTGRPPLEVISAERRMKVVQAQNNRCRLEEDFV